MVALVALLLVFLVLLVIVAQAPLDQNGKLIAYIVVLLVILAVFFGGVHGGYVSLR